MFKLLSILFLVSFTAKAETFTDENGETHGLGLLQNDGKVNGKLFFSPSKALAYPPKLDLRESGHVSAIKNQGNCGSCWSFAITKALESARLKAGLPELDLGEQEMVSCEKEAYGCSGGFMSSADYITRRGLPLESDYPYTASDSRCKNPLPKVADKAVSWSYIGGQNRKPTVEELKTAIATYGTIFVTVSAGGADWGGSTIHMRNCGNRQTNHMVTLVGYNEQDEFIIGNSWGKNWGEQGFAYAKQGCNNLANEIEGAAFVVYEGGPAPVPPKAKLPSDIFIAKDVKAPVGVEQQSGVSYEWYDGEAKIGSGNILWVSPDKSKTYKILAKNNLGTAESSVMIHVDESPNPPTPPGPKPQLNECWKAYEELAFCIGSKAVTGCQARYDMLKQCINYEVSK